MANFIQKAMYNGLLTKKGWNIKGVKTDPHKTKIDADNLSDIQDVNIKLALTKEKGFNDIMVTMIIEGNEYSFILYDEIINHINMIRNNK